MLFARLVASFADDIPACGFTQASLHFARSLRALLFPRQSRRLLTMMEARRGELRLAPRDTFFHLQERHYLSQHLSVRQRIDSVWHHYEHESRHYQPSFRHQVYGGAGLVLWQQTVNGVDFCIRLVPGNDNRSEGELSAVLFVNGARLSVMSFSYVDASVFGLAPGPIIFITRNQSGREALQQGQFRAAFKHTTPPYFCLAAVVGIARANGMSHVAAVRHDSHVAWDRNSHANLENSYTGLWRAFHATPLGKHSYLLAVQMTTVPLSELKAKHRKRALDRREAWGKVAVSAAAAGSEHQYETREEAHSLSTACPVLPPLLAVGA